MGLLAVDLSGFGVVMSADSQRVQITAGRQAVLGSGGSWSRNPIIVRRGGGFTGLVGSVGTETIEGVATASWLDAFSRQIPNATVDAFCDALAQRLTDVWKRGRRKTVLEILATGVVRRDVQFWYVRNSQGIGAHGYLAPGGSFAAVNDLDRNYAPRDLLPGESKASLLARQTYSFWQRTIFPANVVFTGFSGTMQTIYASQIVGFQPLRSLNALGSYSRVRMELLNRLYSPTHGIYAKGVKPPVAGRVHVYGVALNGEVRKYAKNISVELRRAGR